MYEEKYDEAINKIKEVYPHLKDARFEISNGELSWFMDSRFDVDINELQKFVNDFLDQKVYRVEYSGYVDVYARSEDEAKEFTEHLKPKSFTRDVVKAFNDERLTFM